MTPWSVIAAAVIPSSLTLATYSLILFEPSRRLYSVWTCKCAKFILCSLLFSVFHSSRNEGDFQLVEENFVGWWRRISKYMYSGSPRQNIPMNPRKRESCSAMASTIPGFHLHCLEGNRSTYIWKSACSTVSNDFLGVLESSERELMETQIILNCAVTTLFIL